MFKITPNPPEAPIGSAFHSDAIDRALAFYDLQPDKAPPASASEHLALENQREDALVSASSILDSAAATAYDHADNLTGSDRKVAMGVVHLISMAQELLDSALEAPPQPRHA